MLQAPASVGWSHVSGPELVCWLKGCDLERGSSPEILGRSGDLMVRMGGWWQSRCHTRELRGHSKVQQGNGETSNEPIRRVGGVMTG